MLRLLLNFAVRSRSRRISYRGFYRAKQSLLSEVVELLSVALRAVLALTAIAFCLFSSVVQVTGSS